MESELHPSFASLIPGPLHFSFRALSSDSYYSSDKLLPLHILPSQYRGTGPSPNPGDFV